MWNLIKNELIKLRYRKKFLITIIVLSALSILVCIGSYAAIQLSKKYSNPETTLSMLETQRKDPQGKLSQSDKDSLDKSIDDLKKQVEKNKIEKSGEKIDWKVTVKAENESLKMQKEAFIDPNKGNIEKINVQILKNNYLLDHNIKPADDMALNGYSLLLTLFGALSAIFLTIIVAIMTSDIVSGEFTPPTLKVLLTRPVARWKLLLSKFIATTMSAIVIIVFIELLVFIISGLILGFGDLTYPILVGTKFKASIVQLSSAGKEYIPIIGSTYLIPAWSFLIRIFLLQILFIICTSSFCFFLSSVLKSSTLSMTLSIVIIIATSIIISIPYISKAAPFIFVHYGNVVNVLQSPLASQYSMVTSTTPTPVMGIIVLCLWSVVCYAIAHLVFTKRDVLI